MLVVTCPHQAEHRPFTELSGDRLMPSPETPARYDWVLHAIEAMQLADQVVTPIAQPLESLTRLHSEDYVAFLQTGWDAWAKRFPDSQQALPYAFPVPGLRALEPKSIVGQLGRYSFDAGTPLQPGTWAAAKGAADAALTAALRLTAEQRLTVALCRPPGHHASADQMGGYCYLNNAALAAEQLRAQGAARVAVFDVDYHHGNGTQSLFEARSDVLFVSIHADPATDFPYYLGYRDETGVGEGDGYTMNLPLPRGTSWDGYSRALTIALDLIRSYGPDALVLSLGVDTAATDPISHFGLTSDDFRRLGSSIATLRKPTMVALEGGYDLDSIGDNVAAVLQGLRS
jgi:acetoin utilization deacetylase AcuC-like enzyme